MREMIDWLQDAGTKNIVIFDNASTYPPLMEYYKNLPEGVSVNYLGQNCGPWAFWDKGFHLQQRTPYIVTDPDLIPDINCPKDLINQLQLLLHDNPSCGKVGTGLLFPGLVPPETYDPKGKSRYDENMYWTRRHSAKAFYAPIDTTFALYPVGPAKHDYGINKNNLRMDRPYVVKHTPSFYTGIQPPEELYYIAHVNRKWSHVGW